MKRDFLKIYSTYRTGRYESFDGTSMAAPHQIMLIQKNNLMEEGYE